MSQAVGEFGFSAEPRRPSSARDLICGNKREKEEERVAHGVRAIGETVQLFASDSIGPQEHTASGGGRDQGGRSRRAVDSWENVEGE
jgi:hypothetical protein